MPLFVAAVFSGYWQLNAMLDAKTRKLKLNSRACERNQAKLESSCYLSFIWGAIGFFWALQEKRELFGSGSAVIAGKYRGIVPNRRCISRLEVRQHIVET
jgi:hypothetical protein